MLCGLYLQNPLKNVEVLIKFSYSNPILLIHYLHSFIMGEYFDGSSLTHFTNVDIQLI